MSAPTVSFRSRAVIAFIAGLMVIVAFPASILAVGTNDDRANATQIVSLPFSDSQDTTDATTEESDPFCSGVGPTVWYRYDASATVDLLADTFGSSYDTTLSLYVDDGAGGLVQLDCNDDARGTLESQIGWTAQPGTTYWIMVGSCCESPGGLLEFHVTEGMLPPPPDPIDVTIELIDATSSQSSGHVTLRASIVCSADAFGYLAAEFRQRVGRQYVFGYGEANVECGPTPSILELTTWSESGVFAGGPMRVQGFVEVFDELSYGFAMIDDTVRARTGR